MAYVPTDDLKRMCRMLMNHAEIIADNYCFVNKHDEPEDLTDVTQKVLVYLAQSILESVDEAKTKNSPAYFGIDDAVLYMRSAGFSNEQINSIASAFLQKGVVECVQSSESRV